MAIPDPPKAGSPFSPLWTGGWNPKTPEINNFFIPEITLRGGYASGHGPEAGRKCSDPNGHVFYLASNDAKTKHSAATKKN